MDHKKVTIEEMQEVLKSAITEEGNTLEKIDRLVRLAEAGGRKRRTVILVAIRTAVCNELSRIVGQDFIDSAAPCFERKESEE